LSENKAVTDVCNEVGFESIGSFSVLFKKEIGFAPQYYRNMAYKKKMEQLAQPKEGYSSLLHRVIQVRQ
jgi:AraC-like DNA-binding protein